jgi:hypothetical protein
MAVQAEEFTAMPFRYRPEQLAADFRLQPEHFTVQFFGVFILVVMRENLR